MKEQIIKLLEKHADEQGNLTSPWFRDLLANEILSLFATRIMLMQKALEGDTDDSGAED